MVDRWKSSDVSGRDIKKLPSPVNKKIRSILAVTNYAQCVTELVSNSIDAGATCIAVRVDFNSHQIQVVDNGLGIDRKNLEFLAERHMTSKIRTIHDLEHNLQTIGFRGEALASIRDVCRQLQITTRSISSNLTHGKLFLDGKFSSIDVLDVQRHCAGTTISVLDFLYNVPVRRRKVEEHCDTVKIQSQIESLALVHPEISFSLKNVVTGKMLLESRRSESMKETFAQFYGPILADQLRAVEFTDENGLKVEGFISIEGHDSKSYQLIYVNSRVVQKTAMHTSVNNLLSQMLKNKKQKCSVFVLNLSCPYSLYDITLEPQKTVVEFKNWNAILKIFERTVKIFLQEHSYDLPPEAKKTTSKKKIAPGFWCQPLGKEGPTLRRISMGVVSRRQVSSKEIIKEVFLNPSEDPKRSHVSTREIKIPRMAENPQKYQAAVHSSGVKLDNTPPGIDSENCRATWAPVALREKYFNQFCMVVQASFKIFTDFENQPSKSETLEGKTTLTQDLSSLGMVEQISQRPFDFEPVVEKEEESNDQDNKYIHCDMDEIDEESIDLNLEDQLESQEFIEQSPIGYEFNEVNTLVSPKKTKERTSREAPLDLQILKHLTPGSFMLSEIKKTFIIDEREEESIGSNESPAESGSEHGLLFRGLDDLDELRNPYYEQKRKVESPGLSVNSKKSKLADDWLVHEIENGQELPCNDQQARQLLTEGHCLEEKFTFGERHLGYSPLMKLNISPTCLHLESRERQKLSTVAKKRLSKAGEISALSKCPDEEITNDQEQIGLHELIQQKFILAGNRPLPLLAKLDLFGDDLFARMRSSFFHREFPTAMLKSIRVVGQFDKKFVVALVDSNNGSKSNLVILVDQHAAHERVRLEMLIKDHQTAENKIVMAPLYPTIYVCLSKQETRIVQEYHDTLVQFGMECEAISETRVGVVSVPLCFMQKNQLQGWNLKDATRKLLKEIITKLKESNGVCLSMPQEIRDVLNREACHGALKFNMVLTNSASADMMKQLSECQLPFQCAHGRNSIFPALDLDEIMVTPKVQKANLGGFLQKVKALHLQL